MSKARRCWALFITFFKIGLFTFGGGYAMISLIEAEIAERKRWLDSDRLAEVFAIAESTPGPIAINCATYVGFQHAGVAGSAMATLGVTLPSFIIIYVISLFFERFMALTFVAHAFKGIQLAVAFLILRAGLSMARKLPGKVLDIVACAVAGLAVLGINAFGWRFSSVWLIVCGALAGILLARAGKGASE